MSSINSIAALNEVAESHTPIRNILEDYTLGRKKAADMIWNQHGIWVSDKLVRTWRNNQTTETVPGKDFNTVVFELWKPTLDAADTKATIFTMPLIDMHDPKLNTITAKPDKAVSSRQKPKTIVIMPDVQAPLHDKELIAKFVQFLGDYQPTELGQVGDFTDSTEISRWVRGKKPEFAGDLSGGFRSARSIITDIRKVFDGRIRIVRSNHDDRLELYIQACAPGLASLMEEELSFETIMKFKETEVEFIRDAVVELAPGWIMAHGDEGSLSPQAGKTAFGLAKNKFGVNVVCGHTHRAGVTTESYGYNGSIKRSLSGLEVGHFMDLEVADYLKKSGGHANWQQAFGILEIYGDRVYPRLITVQDGSFSVDGQLY